ncbi:34595_t:CDS:2, partial [Racocetra persica]
MQKRLFNTIGYTDNESTGPRIRPDYETESQCGYNKLSEKMKTFSITARAWRINYIKEKLNSKKPLVSHPIPVTVDEEQMQSEE